MRPFFAPGSEVAPVDVPPHGFAPVRELLSVEFRPSLRLVGQASGQTEAQRAGKRYEARVWERLESYCAAAFPGSQFFIGPWFEFRTMGEGLRRAQPDVMLLRANHVLLCEIKAQHTTAAWWQLRELYEPLVRFHWPVHHVSVCEICNTFDASVRLPEAVELVRDFDELLALSDSNYHVLPWRP